MAGTEWRPCQALRMIGQESTTIVPWLGELAFGAVVILALFGYIWFRPAVHALLEDKRRAEEQRDALIQTYQKEIIPVLLAVVDGQNAMVQTLEKDVAPVLGDVKGLLLASGRGSG